MKECVNFNLVVKIKRVVIYETYYTHLLYEDKLFK